MAGPKRRKKPAEPAATEAETKDSVLEPSQPKEEVKPFTSWPPQTKPQEPYSLRVVKDFSHMVVLGILNNVERLRVQCSSAEEMSVEEAKVRTTLREMALAERAQAAS